MTKTDLAIIGGGPAGLAAAIAAYDSGIHKITIIEREAAPGGILNQCIHHGFGLHTFGEELTGPEYAHRYIEMIGQRGIECLTLTTVLSVAQTRDAGREKNASMAEDAGAAEDAGTTKDASHTLILAQAGRGTYELKATAIILAMGCRERSRGTLNIPGYRPAGIYNAGLAQRFVNIDGYLPGKSVVILGSGDIGLIMARRMKLQGADVKMVIEIMPHSGGLTRNIVQCLDDYGIPLLVRTTIVDIDGKSRLRGVTIANVDDSFSPIPGTERYVACDTLLISCGLIPENELTHVLSATMDEATGGPVVNGCLETTVRGVFACGNVLHVHDLVDNVSIEAASAGNVAAAYIKAGGDIPWGEAKRPKAPPKARYTPSEKRDYENQLICIGCPKSCLVTVEKEGEKLSFSGNGCPIGLDYAKKEVISPTRFIASLVRVMGGERRVVSVKTSRDIPKGKIFACMEEIKAARAAAPICVGDVLIKNVAGTDADVVATADCGNAN